MNAVLPDHDINERPDLAVDRHGVATLSLNRPRHHNRLEPVDIDELHALLATIDATSNIRVLVLTARGRSFCSGYDLSDLGAAASSADAPAGIDLLAVTVDRLEQLRLPTLAVLNGPVYGGGTDLALACDFRIATPACRMMMPAGRFGLHYYHGGMRRYVERLGLAAAKRLFLLGETLDAAEMKAIGYLDEVLPDASALDARARAIVQTILEAADPTVIASMKACLNAIASGDTDATAADAFWAATRRSAAVGAAVAASRAARGSAAKP